MRLGRRVCNLCHNASLNWIKTDRYAPFCKHLFVENFTDTHVNAVEITEQNVAKLRSDYEARSAKELPVYVLTAIKFYCCV